MALGGALLIDRLGRRTLFVSNNAHVVLVALMDLSIGGLERRHAMRCVALVLGNIHVSPCLCSFCSLDCHSRSLSAPWKYCGSKW